MRYTFISSLFFLIIAGCCQQHITVDTSATSQCGTEVGKNCSGPLMKWMMGPGQQPWAMDCNIGNGQFCGWCTSSNKPIFYRIGEVPVPSDCNHPKD